MEIHIPIMAHSALDHAAHLSRNGWLLVALCVAILIWSVNLCRHKSRNGVR